MNPRTMKQKGVQRPGSVQGGAVLLPWLWEGAGPAIPAPSLRRGQPTGSGRAWKPARVAADLALQGSPQGSGIAIIRANLHPKNMIKA